MILLKGIITGVILSLPFGPMGIYCMEKTLSEGEKEGYASALGLITADMLYGSLAFIFILTAREHIEKYELAIKIVIIIFLLILGYKKMKGTIVLSDTGDRGNSHFQNYFTAFFLAIINITSTLVLLGIFAFLNVHNGNIVKLILGIFIGGFSMWSLTIYLLSRFRRKINNGTITRISKVTGAIFVAFAFVTTIEVFIKQLNN